MTQRRKDLGGPEKRTLMDACFDLVRDMPDAQHMGWKR